MSRPPLDVLVGVLFIALLFFAVVFAAINAEHRADQRQDFEIKCLNLGGVPMETPRGIQVCTANVPTIEVKP